MKKQTRKPGFTCPECGSPYFGTCAEYCEGQKTGRYVGYCHGEEHTGIRCKFQWVRNSADEARCMYEQTMEEYMQAYYDEVDRLTKEKEDAFRKGDVGTGGEDR